MPVIHEDKFTRVYDWSDGEVSAEPHKFGISLIIVSFLLGPVITVVGAAKVIEYYFGLFGLAALAAAIGWVGFIFMLRKLGKAGELAALHKAKKKLGESM